jgi:cell division protein ZapA (FtsZ GTPase activity inhibitor)
MDPFEIGHGDLTVLETLNVILDLLKREVDAADALSERVAHLAGRVEALEAKAAKKRLKHQARL